MSNAWGELFWGSNSWGAQNSTSVSLSGVSLTSSIGNSTADAEIGSGWGRGTWNNNEAWGIAGTLIPTGVQFTSSIGSVTADAEIGSGWGRGTWNNNEGWGIQGTLIPTGVQFTSSIGSVTADAEIGSGWGRGTWNNNEAWGIAGTLIPSSFQLTSAIGSVTADAEIGAGWGGDAWGLNFWGELRGSGFTVTGISATSSIGSTTITGDCNITLSNSNLNLGLTLGNESVDIAVGPIVTAQQLNSSIGSATTTQGKDQAVTGQQLNSSIGSASVDGSTLTGAGWGRNTWGNLGWGVNFSASATGLSLTSTINFPATGAFTDITVNATAQQMNFSAIGTYSVQIDNDESIIQAPEETLNLTLGNFSLVQSTNESVSGQSISALINSVEATFTVEVSGIAATLTQGSASLEQSTNESVTGQQLNSSIGTAEEIPGQQIGVSGLQLTSSLGSLSAITADANVAVSSLTLTPTAGQVNIFAWNEVQLGVNNVWTDVDLAA